MDSKNISLGLRRLRQSPLIRSMTQEIRLAPSQFVQPLFVVENLTQPEPIPGLSGVYRDTPKSLLKQIEQDLEKGVKSFLLFGVPEQKAETDFKVHFLLDQIRSIKSRFGKDLFLALDVCVCSYTSHGHCGVLSSEQDHIDNAKSVQELVKLALQYAQAGADCVAPSDMMDGRIGAIRKSLDQEGYEKTLLLSYAAKFNSRFYGPFRVAADSAPKSNTLKDRSSYQIDPARPKDAIASALRDDQEGADLLMVKPGLPYLDIIRELRGQTLKPIAVYEVSGEYASLELLAQAGLIDAKLGHLESWMALHRAGAQMIISYGARNAKEWICL